MTNDTFNHADRAGFLERLGRLAGQSTYREPGQGGGSPYSARMMTTENALVLALSFARASKHDIGPEIAFTIGTGIEHRREQVVSWLALKLWRETGSAGRKAENFRNILAQHCYEMVGFGKPKTRLPARLPVSWNDLRNVGMGWLWMQAESTIILAERKLKDESDLQMPKTKNGARSTLTAS